MPRNDLAVLVADKDMELSLRAALERPASLSIRPITFSFIRHPERDGGVRSNGVSLLSRLAIEHAHALMVLDFEGSGAGDMTALELEGRLDDQLRPHWSVSGKAIVIAPELDVWMWGNDDLLREVLGWNEPVSLREWLLAKEFVFGEDGKPERPKEAMEAVMHRLRQPRSSALYRSIASRISLAKCTDPAFVRLRRQLQQWFS